MLEAGIKVGAVWGITVGGVVFFFSGGNQSIVFNLVGRRPVIDRLNKENEQRNNIIDKSKSFALERNNSIITTT